jgi:hypothetical protein
MPIYRKHWPGNYDPLITESGFKDLKKAFDGAPYVGHTGVDDQRGKAEVAKLRVVNEGGNVVGHMVFTDSNLPRGKYGVAFEDSMGDLISEFEIQLFNFYDPDAYDGEGDIVELVT